MPRTSAIVLTYNRLSISRQAVVSALWQTDDDLEIIVVDNGSQDGTQEWLSTLYDDRLRIIALPENGNPTHARNLGVEAASGQWLAMLDDDDIWAPDNIAARVAHAEAADATWAYSGCFYVDGQTQVIAGTPSPSPEQVAARTPVAHTIPGGLSALLWRADALDGDGLLDERLTYTIDWDMTARLLRSGLPAYVDRPLLANRQHLSFSRTADDKRWQYDVIEEKHADLRGDLELLHYIHDRYMGSEALHAGAHLDAARHFVKAVRAGDRSSVLRLTASALPVRLQAVLRRRLLSDAEWMAAGRAWLGELDAALEQGTVSGIGTRRAATADRPTTD